MTQSIGPDGGTVQTNRLVVSKNDTVQITFRVRARNEAICSRVTNVDGEKVVAEVPDVMPSWRT